MQVDSHRFLRDGLELMTGRSIPVQTLPSFLILSAPLTLSAGKSSPDNDTFRLSFKCPTHRLSPGLVKWLGRLSLGTTLVSVYIAAWKWFKLKHKVA